MGGNAAALDIDRPDDDEGFDEIEEKTVLDEEEKGFTVFADSTASCEIMPRPRASFSGVVPNLAG